LFLPPKAFCGENIAFSDAGGATKQDKKWLKFSVFVLIRRAWAAALNGVRINLQNWVTVLNSVPPPTQFKGFTVVPGLFAITQAGSPGSSPVIPTIIERANSDRPQKRQI
jgi:hypothetical protein